MATKEDRPPSSSNEETSSKEEKKAEDEEDPVIVPKAQAADQIASEIKKRLKKDAPRAFSSRALDVVSAKIFDALQTLLRDAEKYSEKCGSETVSPNHVQRVAQDRIVPRNGRRQQQYRKTFGGVFFGAALSILVVMIREAQYTTTDVLISFVLGVGGVALIFFPIGRN